jgi:hypothetical protein
MNWQREEAFRQAAEKMRLKKEKEAREEREYYERITSGNPWLLFKLTAAFCTLMAVLTTIETFVDGPSKKLTEKDWKIDRDWEWTWHQILDVEGYMFSPLLSDWLGHVPNSLELTYTPIFHTGKKLSYDMPVTGDIIRRHEQMRDHSIFEWFPLYQLALLIPLFTFIFKRQSPWFNFARALSLFIILPGTVMVLVYLTMY